jgi:hypothetical protein
MILSWKKVFALGVAVALLGAISVYAVDFFTGKESAASRVMSTLTWGQLELKLELDKTEFEQGEPINITGSLKNIGNTSITIIFSVSGTRVLYEIHDANGTKVQKWPMVFLGALDRFTLEPNEQVSITYTWNQNSIISEYEFYQKQVPKGTYTIVGKTVTFRIGDERLLYEPLKTPPITITIK